MNQGSLLGDDLCPFLKSNTFVMKHNRMRTGTWINDKGMVLGHHNTFSCKTSNFHGKILAVKYILIGCHLPGISVNIGLAGTA